MGPWLGLTVVFVVLVAFSFTRDAITDRIATWQVRRLYGDNPEELRLAKTAWRWALVFGGVAVWFRSIGRGRRAADLTAVERH